MWNYKDRNLTIDGKRVLPIDLKDKQLPPGLEAFLKMWPEEKYSPEDQFDILVHDRPTGGLLAYNGVSGFERLAKYLRRYGGKNHVISVTKRKS